MNVHASIINKYSIFEKEIGLNGLQLNESPAFQNNKSKIFFILKLRQPIAMLNFDTYKGNNDEIFNNE